MKRRLELTEYEAGCLASYALQHCLECVEYLEETKEYLNTLIRLNAHIDLLKFDTVSKSTRKQK